MNPTKQTFIVAFALFSLFFGAGNLILPPLLGYNAGSSWPLVLLGFAISAVIIPILAIYGHARLQGTLLDFANKVSPVFAVVYGVIVYAISISLPSPRTASVTYEMSIAPYFEMSSLTLSAIYFSLVLVFALNRTKILSLIGKFLTPLIILILLVIISIGLFADVTPMKDTIFSSTFTDGILEGYQTFDAIGGVVVGGVIVVSLALQGKFNYEEKKQMIAKAGLLAGFGLIIIYGGLIALGASYNTTIITEDRVELLQVLSTTTLGNIGTSFLGVLVALACFTTAVGIVTGTSDFVKKLTGNSQLAYTITAVIGCIIGVAVGQFDVHYIIAVAVPALMFIYPITIVLILLNVLPQQFATPLVFKVVTILTILFSIPDFVGFFLEEGALHALTQYIPLATKGMGWVLPAFLGFVGVNLWLKGRRVG
ncbi:branched-chain amino acid transport system carrier protein [Patiriisocius marinus]|uniref:Branched-chain amino acid transport system carrier protein n=1 Tax=Patiriisocius marinus TaxID=1397112 RepID=A0A5J4IVJ1_9FLAO|nr:branched-chain amino acid transport system II carrier protein [Patiriisocius marinus]GER58856.1 branched-chain amino acid transport system carrier protein [Patiriisocius marinus]